jgi:glucose uptake protein GlcU
MSPLHFFKLAANACGTQTGFLPSLYDNLPCKDGGVQITSADQIWVLVANLAKILTAMAGALAVIFIIVGGIWYVTSAGDPARLKRAKEIINQSIIGLIITAVAYTVVVFVANAF